MKNTFDFRRFVQVCRLTWQTQPVLPYIILLAAVPLMFLYFFNDARTSFVSLRNQAPFILFMLYLCGCGWLYAGIVFNELSKTGNATRFLMTPASVLEKWLAKSLLVLLVFPLIACIAYNAAFQLFGLLSVRWFAFHYLSIDWFSPDIKVTLFFFYLGLPWAFASGLVWKRLGVLKGLIFFFILLVVLYQVMGLGFGQYAPDSGEEMLLQKVLPPFYGTEADAGTQSLIGIFWLMGGYLPSALLLASTYLFIKERSL